MMPMEQRKQRYLQVAQADGLSEYQLNRIQSRLSVILPEDFREIASFFGGGELGAIDIYDLADGNPDIVSETLRLREAISLPQRFIVLAEPSESLLVLDVKGIPAVIWCDACDAGNLGSGHYSLAPDTWDSFGDFFDEMLDEMMENF